MVKLSGAAALGFVRKPDPAGQGALIFGEDAMRVAQRRAELVLSLIGPTGEAEMRLDRFAAGELRKDPARLTDSLKATGFFPGPRVVLVDDGTDALAPVLVAAMQDWRPGDAQLVVTAGALTAKSALRKLFETAPRAVCIGLYDDPPGADEIAAMLAAAGLTRIDPEARAAITALSRSLDPGDFRQTIDKLGLYHLNEPGAVSVADVEAMAPQSVEGDIDLLLQVVGDGREQDIAGVLRRLYAQGEQPTTLCIMGLRHARALHVVASDPGGAQSGINRLRPPVYGPRRDTLIRQAGRIGRDRIEQCLGLWLETDLALRSADRTVPAQALVERTLIRMARMAR